MQSVWLAVYETNLFKRNDMSRSVRKVLRTEYSDQSTRMLGAFLVAKDAQFWITKTLITIQMYTMRMRRRI